MNRWWEILARGTYRPWAGRGPSALASRPESVPEAIDMVLPGGDRFVRFRETGPVGTLAPDRTNAYPD